MAEMTKSDQNNNDEIDLIQVLERITRFISTYKKELIVTMIAGLLCGTAIYISKPKIYGSTLILHSQILSNSEEIRIIDSWNTLRNNGEFAVLSRNLDYPVSLIKNVKALSATDIQITQPSSGFTVDVLVSDTAILEGLQKAIIYGLENSQYVSEKVNFKKENTLKMLESINREIARLDSTKKKIESSQNAKSSGASSFIIDISDVNVQMITLKEKYYQYQEALKFVDAIQVLQNFEKYAKPTSPRLGTLLISGLLGGLFVGFAWAIIKNLKLKIAAFRKIGDSRISDKELV
jgi:hypothetical protein